MQQPFRKIIALPSLLIGLGIILGYIERLIFPQGLAYGIKLGISNIVVIFAMMYLGKKHALCVGVLKSVLSGILFSSVSAVLYSATGIILSVFLMAFLKEHFYPGKMSVTGISIAGSAAFNVGQILIACAITKSTASAFLLVYMLPLSVVTGGIIGIITHVLLNRLKRGL